MDPNNNPNPGLFPTPGGTPPGNYPAPPAPPAPAPIDPNEPPAWAKSLIDTVGELRTGYDQLNELLQDPGTDPNNPPAPPVQQGDPNADPYANFKPGNWSDIPREAEKIADRIVTEKLNARDQAAAEAQRQANDARTAVDRELDQQETKLRQSGFLPEVKNPGDPNDPGRLAKRELYAVATSLNTTDLDGVSRQIKAMHDAGMNYDIPSNSWVRGNTAPPGSFAPVGSSAGGNAPGGGQTVSYDQIHKARSLQELAATRGLQ